MRCKHIAFSSRRFGLIPLVLSHLAAQDAREAAHEEDKGEEEEGGSNQRKRPVPVDICVTLLPGDFVDEDDEAKTQSHYHSQSVLCVGRLGKQPSCRLALYPISLSLPLVCFWPGCRLQRCSCRGALALVPDPMPC